MILDRLMLENFRQYFERNIVNFARDAQYNVTVIHGVNGAGKTSLFLALNWCLYGRSVDNVMIIDNVGELMSKEAIQRADVGATLQLIVELSFFHDGDRYIARRKLSGTKQPNGGFLPASKSESFGLSRVTPSGTTEQVPNPVGMINAMLPSNVRTYFLFDGEKIDNFAKPEAAKEVKEAIRLVLKLEILDRAKRHLRDVAADYRQELKTLTTSTSNTIVQREQQAVLEQNQAEQRTSELQAEIESARSKIADVEAQLRATQGVRELQINRDQLADTIKQLHGQREQTTSQIRDLATSAYFLLAQPAIERALTLLNEKRERGEIPSNIRQQFVHDLLDARQCICGRSLHDGSPEHEQVLGLLQNSVSGSLENDVLNTHADLRSFHDRAERHKTDLTHAIGHRMTNNAELEALEGQLSDIRRQLGTSEDADVRQLEKKRTTFQANVDSFILELGSIQENLRRLNEEIKSLRQQREKALKEEARTHLLNRKLGLAEDSADAIGQVYDAFADQMRRAIEAKTREIFQSLALKGPHFADVRLSADYNLEVIDRYGTPSRPELSAGERQVLSLAFITAMAQVSEEEAPLVMDTPFGRLSSQHRNSITAQLPALASQLILFVTDEELRDEARHNLEPRIGAEYRLEFSPHTSCTTIEEGK